MIETIVGVFVGLLLFTLFGRGLASFLSMLGAVIGPWLPKLLKGAMKWLVLLGAATGMAIGLAMGTDPLVLGTGLVLGVLAGATVGSVSYVLGAMLTPKSAT